MAGLILAVAMMPRVIDLGVFLTADEKNWIGRSYEFIRAFKDWRFNEMLQTTHPGVTTLWLGGITVTAKMLGSHIPFSAANLIHFIRPTQLPVAITNAILVLVIYILLRQVWPQRRMVSALAALMIALDPFIIGYSRVTHVDALLGGFMMAAGLAILVWAKQGFSIKWLFISALLTALAGLTKAPAVFLLPYFGLVVLVMGRGQWQEKQFWVNRARDFVTWLLLIGIMVVIVWPALLWVPNPEGNVLVLKRDFSIAAATPHNMNSEYALNGSFYWYTIITRSTPMTLWLAGTTVVSMTLLFWPRKRKVTNDAINSKEAWSYNINSEEAKTLWLVAAYIFFFVVMMMLGAKKGDRYILPVFFALNILSAFGAWTWAVVLGQALARHSKRNRINVTTLMAVIILVIVAEMGWVIYQHHPYTIAYSNPLLPDNLSQELGWGEGLDQVAKWLNQNDPEAIVASWYPEELAAYTSAQVAHINAHEQNRVKYVVLYRNMFGRERDHYANNFIDEYYKKKEPVYTATITGKEFAWVYRKKVYDKVLPEIAAGGVVSQAVEVEHPGLIGLEIMAATFSGQATDGFIEIEVVREIDGRRMATWRQAVSELNDRGWTSYMMDQVSNETGWYTVNIMTSETGQKAPTIRYKDDVDEGSRKMIVNAQEKPGNLAIRIKYRVGDEIVTEDDTKRLPTN